MEDLYNGHYDESNGVQPAEEPSDAFRCPILSLPDETISRIFTIGVEFDISRYDSRLFPVSRKPRFVRRPYDITAHVELTCRRFRTIALSRCNAHLYYMSMAICNMIDIYDWLTAELCEKQFVQMVNATKVHQGWDIHVLIDVDSIVGSDWEIGYLYHIFQLLHSLRAHISAVDLIIPEKKVWALDLAVRWLASDPQSWKRLHCAYFGTLGRGDSGRTRWTTPPPFYHEFLKLSNNPAEGFGFSHPSLAALCFVHPAENQLLRALGLPALTALTTVMSSSSEPSEWHSIRWLLTGCETLRRIRLRIRHLVPPSDLIEMVNSKLVELTLEMDVLSLHTIFTQFSFPLTVEACIIIEQTSEDMDNPDNSLLEDSIHFPSLEKIGFAAPRGPTNIPFLERCKTPLLSHLSLAMREGQLAPLQSTGATLLGPVRTLALSFQDENPSLEMNLRSLDLSHLVELEIYSSAGDAAVRITPVTADDGSDILMPIPVPELTTVKILYIQTLWDALTWLHAYFHITSPITLIVNHSHTFSLAPSDEDDTRYPHKILSARLRNPLPLYRHTRAICIDRYFKRDLYNRGLLRHHAVPYAQDLLAFADANDPELRQLAVLDISIEMYVHSYLDNTPRAPHLLLLLSRHSYCNASGGAIPYPSLRELRVTCSYATDQFLTQTMARLMQRVVLIRRSLGIPLQIAEIVADNRRWDFAHASTIEVLSL
jgi:hypothetical protein